MSKIFMGSILLILMIANNLFADEKLLVVKDNCTQTVNGVFGFCDFAIHNYDISTETTTLLIKQTGAEGLVTGFNDAKSYQDEKTGLIYLATYTNNNATPLWRVYDPSNNTLTNISTPSIRNTYIGSYFYEKNLIVQEENGQTVIEEGSENAIKISVNSSEYDIQSGSGQTMIKQTSDGATHIGENSLVTIESGGRQQLYATDSSGNRIDINIPSGTNLLIDGEDVMGSIDSSIALGAAFASLPTGAEGAGYTCGLGTGFHDSASAISGGCGFDFANYSFVDSMPEMFQKASFNIGAASVVYGEGDDATLKAGITFKFGAPKPVREARDDNLLLENKIDAVMAKNEAIQTENNLIREENDLLKAQIAEINTQLKALNMLAMN